MTPEELSAIRRKGETCRAKGCRCLARCYHAWNKWWMERADVCTQPNWFPPDDGNGPDREAESRKTAAATNGFRQKELFKD